MSILVLLCQVEAEASLGLLHWLSSRIHYHPFALLAFVVGMKHDGEACIRILGRSRSPKLLELALLSQKLRQEEPDLAPSKGRVESWKSRSLSNVVSLTVVHICGPGFVELDERFLIWTDLKMRTNEACAGTLLIQYMFRCWSTR